MESNKEYYSLITYSRGLIIEIFVFNTGRTITRVDDNAFLSHERKHGVNSRADAIYTDISICMEPRQHKISFKGSLLDATNRKRLKLFYASLVNLSVPVKTFLLCNTFFQFTRKVQLDSSPFTQQPVVHLALKATRPSPQVLVTWRSRGVDRTNRAAPPHLSCSYLKGNSCISSTRLRLQQVIRTPHHDSSMFYTTLHHSFNLLVLPFLMPHPLLELCQSTFQPQMRMDCDGGYEVSLADILESSEVFYVASQTP